MVKRLDFGKMAKLQIKNLYKVCWWGLYTITATHANTSIELANGTTIIGTKITQYANNGSDAQKWIIKEAGNGEYYIISKNSELYMTVENEEVKEGANLINSELFRKSCTKIYNNWFKNCCRHRW